MAGLAGLTGMAAGLLGSIVLNRRQNRRDYLEAKHPLPTIERTPAQERLHHLVEEFYSLGPRMVGTEAEKEARDRIVANFRTLGLQEIRTERVPVLDWKGKAKLWQNDQTFDAVPFGGARTTTKEACLVDVGNGLPEDYARLSKKDLRGKFHLARVGESHRIQKYLQAFLHGAKGLILAHETEGFVEIGTGFPVMPIPAVSVSRDTGEALLSSPSPVKIAVAAQRQWRLAENVTGIVPGKISKEVLIGAHFDAWNGGAYDNAGGLAALLETAAHFKQNPGYRTARFSAFTAEELNMQGSLWGCLLHPHRLLNTTAMINFDALGAKEGKTYLNLPEEFEARIRHLPAFDRFEATTGRRVEFLHPPLVFSDLLWYHASGIPCAWLVDLPVAEYHTPFDTPAIIDWNLLEEEIALNLAIADFFLNGR
ncbi:MAG: M28 family peptidase [Bacteroidota bacterium]